MRVLFVPFPNEGIAHIIPLVALHQLARRQGAEMAFLLSQGHKDKYGEVLEEMQVKVLPHDYKATISSEMMAFAAFRPDVVVDDFSLSTGYSCQLMRTARVTIQRTGQFEGGNQDGPYSRYKHSSGVSISDFPDVSMLGLEQITSLPGCFRADASIVPGIPSLEVLPPALARDPNYFFAGPLILDDYVVPADLADFFHRNRNRPKVYLTYGINQGPANQIHECLQYLLDQDIAFVTSVPNQVLQKSYPDRYHYAYFLPMHYVCAHADLVIHHCGSGAYHYPLLHEAPFMTIGTGCYDREEVAVRLAQLGVSDHLPAPDEVDDFGTLFNTAVLRNLHAGEQTKKRRAALLAGLKAEIEATRAAFRIEQVLDAALRTFRASRKPARPLV